MYIIKNHGSKSQGQEEATCNNIIMPCASSGLCDHYSELFTQMAVLNF